MSSLTPPTDQSPATDHGPATDQADPATAPVIPGAPVVKKTERPHPATPFIRGWLVLVAVIFAWGQQLIPDGENDGLDYTDLRWVLPAIGGVVVLAAVAGFASWYFTRFVIDDDELRIETGAVFKNSKKIPFERLQSVDIIQPLAARIFGLVELRLEAGAGDSTVKLRYLKRAKASQLRDYLLTRAHGQHASISDLGDTAAASALTDLGSSDVPLVKVSSQRLLISFLLSTELIISAATMIIILIVTTSLDVTVFALGGLIPLLFGAFSLVSRRLISMFNFTLAESPRGLRVTRGLTNLTSQSVPVNRIQGVKTTQSFLWKRMGWYRIDVDILGYATSDSESNDSAATSVLLPVATAEEVALALDRVLPGFDLASIERHPSPRQARWVRWFDFWTLRYGWNERAVITEHGWLNHVVDVVPHAKTQSVRIEQGPLQRRLGLADVHFDTPKGPVRAIAQELDVTVARELALSQLDRARAARAADREADRAIDRAGPGAQDRAGEAGVLSAYGISRDQLIGEGGETEVFALDKERVLRLYRSRHEAPRQTVDQLRYLYGHWQGTDIGIEVPLILDSGERVGRTFTMDRRFSGRSFSSWLRTAEESERRAALRSYLDAVDRIQRLPSPVRGFARLVGEGAGTSYATVGELLHAMLAGPVSRSRAQLQADFPDVGRLWDILHRGIATRNVQPALVHGDICPPNTYVSLDPQGRPIVTGIGDFSPHTMNADPLIDVTGAVAFLELEDYPGSTEDGAWLESVAAERWGDQVHGWLDLYRLFYAFYFSDTATSDPQVYAWCLRQLNR
ncbi:MAG TPA: PH domain-containing protein [Propionibacteriaceae bacterium]